MSAQAGMNRRFVLYAAARRAAQQHWRRFGKIGLGGRVREPGCAKGKDFTLRPFRPEIGICHLPEGCGLRQRECMTTTLRFPTSVNDCATAEPEHVDTADPGSVRRWALEFRLTEVELLRAVRSVGTRVSMLRSLLDCPAR